MIMPMDDNRCAKGKITFCATKFSLLDQILQSPAHHLTHVLKKPESQ
jgi:hypothetical protein